VFAFDTFHVERMYSRGGWSADHRAADGQHCDRSARII